MKARRSTIRDVAKLANVAPITVSRVINNSGYISADTRERVEIAIAELNYIPNTLSQSLRFQRTDMIALMVSDITNPFWTTVTRGVEDTCSEYGLNVILCNTDEDAQKFEQYVRLLMQRQMDGFLLIPTSQDSTAIKGMIQNHVPLVMIDRSLPDLQVPIVRSDSVHGGYLLTQHLIELGHRRIAVISGLDSISTSWQRVEGYKKALQEYRIPLDPKLICYASYTQISGYTATNDLLAKLDEIPTAFFAANNFIAMGIMRALMERNLQVPKDVSIVSFDELPYDMISDRFFTVVVQDPYLLGKRAAEVLIKQIMGEPVQETEIVLPVELIIRSSTAPPAR